MRNYNTLIGRYPRRRRHEDRLHLRLRLQSRRHRDPQRQAADRGGARRAVVGRMRAVKAAELLERGFHRGPLSWLTPSLGTVDALQPINADAAQSARRDVRHASQAAGRRRGRRRRSQPTSAPIRLMRCSCRACRARRQGRHLLQECASASRCRCSPARPRDARRAATKPTRPASQAAAQKPAKVRRRARAISPAAAATPPRSRPRASGRPRRAQAIARSRRRPASRPRSRRQARRSRRPSRSLNARRPKP